MLLPAPAGGLGDGAQDVSGDARPRGHAQEAADPEAADGRGHHARLCQAGRRGAARGQEVGRILRFCPLA